MGRHQRNKGKRGEREARDQAIEHWGAAPDRCKRTAQVDGTLTADIKDALPGAHVEVKFYKAFAAIRHLEQAESDKDEDELPVVLLRENGKKDWVVMFRMKDSVGFAQRVVNQRWGGCWRCGGVL